MKEISNLFQDALSYFKLFPNLNYGIIILVGVAILFMILPIFASKFIRKKDYTVVFNSQFSKAVSLLILLIIIVTYAVYNTIITNVILNNNLQSYIFILFIAVFIVLFFSVNEIYKKIKSNDIVLLSIQSGPIALKNIQLKFRKKIKILRILILITFLPYLMLFISKKVYTYGIIIDNSVSMSDKLVILHQQLSSIANNLPKNSKFVITSLPICDPTKEDCSKYLAKLNIDDITSISDVEKLAPITEVYSTKDEFIKYLDHNDFETSNIGSPLIESIWQNYNIATDQNTNPLKLLMFTDGEDNLYSNNVLVRKPSQCVFDLFSQKVKSPKPIYDNVTIIQFAGLGGDRFYNYCSNINILEGNDNGDLIYNTNAFFKDEITDMGFVFILLALHMLLLIIFYLFNHEN